MENSFFLATLSLLIVLGTFYKKCKVRMYNFPMQVLRHSCLFLLGYFGTQALFPTLKDAYFYIVGFFLLGTVLIIHLLIRDRIREKMMKELLQGKHPGVDQRLRKAAQRSLAASN